MEGPNAVGRAARSCSNNIFALLTDELLVSVCGFLIECSPASSGTRRTDGIKDMGRLVCVCKRLASMSSTILHPKSGSRDKPKRVGGAASKTQRVPPLSIVDAAAKLVLDAMPQNARRGLLRELDQPWLHFLYRVLQTGWGRHSRQYYAVSAGGTMLTATEHPYRRVVEGGAPMVIGGVGNKMGMYYAEIEVLSLGLSTVFIGVARPGLDIDCPSVQRTENFWGMGNNGKLSHAGGGQHTTGVDANRYRGTDWHFKPGDTLGLLLDCRVGVLTVFKKGAPMVMAPDFQGRQRRVWEDSEVLTRLGTAVTGLTGELCWAVALSAKDASLRIRVKAPPNRSPVRWAPGARAMLRVYDDSDYTAA